MTAGLLFALLSAGSFGASGSLARGLLETGWTSGAAVLARISIAAAVLAIPAAVALRGRWWLLRSNAGMIAAYGMIAVAGCQLTYFLAVERMSVAVALLIEYTAPVAVVVWMWLRHGHRPSRRTVIGGVIAGAGLVLVLDLAGAARVDGVGLLWALGAMIGAATYFVLSAHPADGLPPITLAGSGLAVGAIALAVAGVIGIVPMRASTSDAIYGGSLVDWWVPVLLLGVVTAAIAYTTGIAAGRRLGSRLASFVALSEVVAAMVFAWLLLGELPGAIQLLGGVLILVGVVLVKLGEKDVVIDEPEAATVARAAVMDRP
ncbi:DMT family transporter [Blastococcus sp. Marseille-P5729]|uniref:EamA family transporter n=1 Tax=Blastococcus sp. Marseille-P5729 TaxID=2086582 RepID=UPI0018FE78EC|nr:DMT family transporter [Blastococcus sp. Marseille-P5729]